MDYTDIVKKSIAYIHCQYSEPITVSDVASHVYLSSSHLSTVFRTLTSYTMKDYILRYRLYQTALELKGTNKRIIEIAYEKGFSSQQALTKSFSQFYGISPAKFRQLNPNIKPFPLNLENLLKERGISMELKKVFEKVQFVKKDSFFVIGIETDINYHSSEGTQGISDLYKQWENENLIENIPNQVHDQLCYGMTHSETENDTAKYIVAVEVSTLENIPTGLIGRRFDATEYAVFDCTLEDETSGKFFQYFFKTFLKENNLSLPDAVITKNGNTYSRYPLFEVYNRHFKNKTDPIQIYAPIKRR
ncbi:AraC family transcriptional regulator [Alkaliphilus transvaalensis]|uniref:AraC family transcriptional regulator n=1 Tax=Alkaliphilus transvaalensis TaxID=114628 RepID=UPI000479F8B1|nr:AraC family transcriptional regulator [Alkaliphilus transvaalensis]